MKTIYFAGGCFWGVQKFFDQFEGVVSTETGYANGPEKAPSYQEVCRSSGHAETVKVVYDENRISLTDLVQYYFMVIDPLSVNKQGEDTGIQYRTGIYYTDEEQLAEARGVYEAEEEKAGAKLAVELEPLRNFFTAEEYHQKYLVKNPGGYCHIPRTMFHLKKTVMDERIRKQLDFSLEIDKEKNVFRQTHLSGHGRNENDAEHAWHMAIMAYLLREYANEEVDIAKVMLMCLIHDIVEIDAGDTYAYDEEGRKTQKAREDAAKERIFSLLPEDQRSELTALFDEFEEYRTAEAKFAHAMDNLQPLILNNSNNGSDWKEHGVSAGTVYGRQTKTRLGSEKLYEITDRIIRENIRKGNLPDDRSE